MEKKDLVELYARGGIYSDVLDFLAGRQRARRNTNLVKFARDSKLKDFTPVFEELENLGFGTLADTQFFWRTKSTNVGLISQGKEVEFEHFNARNIPQVKEHTLSLRNNFKLKFKLPSDVTQNEVTQLTQYLKNIEVSE